MFGVRGAVGAAVALAIAPGCVHTYVFGEGNAPHIEEMKLVVAEGRSESERFGINRIRVAELGTGRFRSATSSELSALMAGRVPSGTEVRIEVDKSVELWRDWGLGGLGVGATLVLVTLGVFGVVQPDSGSDFAFDMPLTLLFAGAAGVEFALIGAGLGLAFVTGETDMRNRAP